MAWEGIGYWHRLSKLSLVTDGNKHAFVCFHQVHSCWLMCPFHERVCRKHTSSVVSLWWCHSSAVYGGTQSLIYSALWSKLQKQLCSVYSAATLCQHNQGILYTDAQVNGNQSAAATIHKCVKIKLPRAFLSQSYATDSWDLVGAQYLGSVVACVFTGSLTRSDAKG